MNADEERQLQEEKLSLVEEFRRGLEADDKDHNPQIERPVLSDKSPACMGEITNEHSDYRTSRGEK